VGAARGMAGMRWRAVRLYATARLRHAFLHTLLRGVSRDRLSLLGEEYFHYVLRAAASREAAEGVDRSGASGERVVLVGQL